jgi:hypothetical protein
VKKILGRIFLVAHFASFVACHRENQSNEILANQANPHPGHRRQILVTAEGLPPDSYVMLGPVREGGTWMRTDETYLDRLAESAQGMGADMIIDMKTAAKFSMTNMGWAEKYAEGKAVALKNPCAFDPSSVAGNYYPRYSGRGGLEPSIFSTCKAERGAAHPDISSSPVPTLTAPAAARDVSPHEHSESTSAGCSLEQILTMKNAGLSDDKIKKACH